MASSQTISLTNPIEGSIHHTGDTLKLSAEIANPASLHVVNNQTGYRKLKIGYSPTNLYTPLNNVISGGNTALEITICNFGASIDWSKIQIRPQSSSSAPVVLAPYVIAAGGIGSAWKTISIPLSDFDPSINLMQISLIEFPYSAGGGNFNIGISKMAFTGGATPFIWFGPDHTNNIHNGNNGAGELLANLVTPTQGSVPVDHVEFYAGTQLIGSTSSQPYLASWVTTQPGNFNVSAVVKYSDGSSITSLPVGIQVIDKPVSTLKVRITSPINGDSFNSGTDIPLTAIVDGLAAPEPAWIHVTNTQTGTRKLKIGYNPTNIYSPLQNVLAGGNTMMEITLKDLVGNTNWSKIQVRPQGSTAVPLYLSKYVANVSGIANEWKTISIPLADFDPSINFSQLSLIEFPYSLSAGNLDLGIQQIRFTGGTAPFIWFGGSKADNSHNGNGGAGELVATIVPQALAGPGAGRVDFYADNVLVGTDYIAPYEYNWSNASNGSHIVIAKVTDNKNLSGLSDPVQLDVVESNPNTVTITVQFATLPTTFNVQKAALRYNKAFAHSFTLDDGLIDAFTVAYPFLKGGLINENGITYPGLFYSDGCGNPIAFSGGLSWYSVNSLDKDLHLVTPAYMTWNQLTTVYNSGWNVFNHSYSHAAYGTTDYVYQINQNTSFVKAKTGIDLTHFVIPSGDQAYITPAFANGMLSVSGNNNAFRGSPNGYRIDQPIDFNNFRLFKRLVCDANNTTANVMQGIDNAAALSVNGQHYWWSDFTHHVGFQTSGSSMLFPLFQYYMENIAQQYGIAGADNIWMAPMQDVYEYLSVRDNSIVNYSLTGSTLTITVDFSKVPTKLRTNALTLVLDVDQDFTNVTVRGAQNYSYKGTGAKKIINLQWGTSNTLKSAEIGAIDIKPMLDATNQPAGFSVFPNPFTNRISVHPGQQLDGKTTFQLVDLSGKTVFGTTIVEPVDNSQIDLKVGETDLQPGVYFLRISNRNATLPTVKLLKIKD
jgi:hypothetical protein